jgi:hypothetical protein
VVVVGATVVDVVDCTAVVVVVARACVRPVVVVAGPVVVMVVALACVRPVVVVVAGEVVAGEDRTIVDVEVLAATGVPWT